MERSNLNKDKSNKPDKNTKNFNALKSQNEELKKLVNELREKQKKLETLAEEIGEAFLIGNKKGQILQCNKKAALLLNYTKEELLLKKISDILFNQHVPESFSRRQPDEPNNEFSSEQILIQKGAKKLYVSTLTTLLPDGRYQDSTKKY